MLWELVHESTGEFFNSFFLVLPIFNECFYDSIETRRTCFLFPLKNTAPKKKTEKNLFTLIINM